MRVEFYEYSGLAENPLIRNHIIANPAYEEIIELTRKKSVKLNIILRVIFNEGIVRIVGNLFDVFGEPPRIIEAFCEEMAEEEFERMHEYYLFGFYPIEMESY